ncbi:hypothetical protein [Arenimonas oryziterrae]|uniref:Lipoprotein SmpA/OmlA domain-containing protein n=1 Tax=Arenimonas oryziterrae DSM 21050 = YC6267 TaxID=1121015 RepID=A0A091AW18_9GAMM|nr:hypothetical protein [Arenimonas oryziterrae]KFN44468.1 hypothetical protein N789_00240 [Arenimonas oryziterrae DSM 21050 = YC6267]
MKRITLSLALSFGLLAGAAAQADTLLIQRVQTEQGISLPKRGATMAQVEAQFGAPTQKFGAVAGPGSRKRNPPITRWAYNNFNVFFEYNHVVDAVVVKARPEEIGPAPVRN